MPIEFRILIDIILILFILAWPTIYNTINAYQEWFKNNIKDDSL